MWLRVEWDKIGLWKSKTNHTYTNTGSWTHTDPKWEWICLRRPSGDLACALHLESNQHSNQAQSNGVLSVCVTNLSFISPPDDFSD